MDNAEAIRIKLVLLAQGRDNAWVDTYLETIDELQHFARVEARRQVDLDGVVKPPRYSAAENLMVAVFPDVEHSTITAILDIGMYLERTTTMPDMSYFFHKMPIGYAIDDVFARDLRAALRKLDAAVGPAMLDTNERRALVDTLDFLTNEIDIYVASNRTLNDNNLDLGARALADVVRKALR